MDRDEMLRTRPTMDADARNRQRDIEMSVRSVIRSCTIGLVAVLGACSKDTIIETPPPPPPVLTLTPAAVTFHDTVGTASPSAATVTVGSSDTTGLLRGLGIGAITYGVGASG